MGTAQNKDQTPADKNEETQIDKLSGPPRIKRNPGTIVLKQSRSKKKGPLSECVLSLRIGRDKRKWDGLGNGTSWSERERKRKAEGTKDDESSVINKEINQR